VYSVLQAHAATVFYALHNEKFWGACIEDGTGGVPFENKDKVMMALSAFGRKAGAIIGGEFGGEGLAKSAKASQGPSLHKHASTF